MQYQLSEASLSLLPDFKQRENVRTLVQVSLDIPLKSPLCICYLIVLMLTLSWSVHTQVLMHLRYLNVQGVVQHKGRVACQLNAHEVFLTELLHENVFADCTVEETVALLSSLVFQQVCNSMYAHFLLFLAVLVSLCELCKFVSSL